MAICSLSMLSRIAWQICAHAMCASIELALFDEGGWTSSSCANPADAHRARCIKSGMRCNPGLRATCSRCCNRARSISSFSIACNILLRLSSRYSFCSSRSLMATCNEWQLSDWQEETGDELRLLVSRMQRNTYASCLPKFGADSLIGRHFLEVLQPVHQERVVACSRVLSHRPQTHAYRRMTRWLARIGLTSKICPQAVLLHD